MGMIACEGTPIVCLSMNFVSALSSAIKNGPSSKPKPPLHIFSSYRYTLHEHMCITHESLIIMVCSFLLTMMQVCHEPC